jgi:hypothetical protein
MCRKNEVSMTIDIVVYGEIEEGPLVIEMMEYLRGRNRCF